MALIKRTWESKIAQLAPSFAVQPPGFLDRGQACCFSLSVVRL